MEELMDVFSGNQILILGIVMFILFLISLGYVITIILSSKKNKRELEKSKNNIEKRIEKNEELAEVENQEKVKIDSIEIPTERVVSINSQEKVSNELEEMLNKMQKTLDEKEAIDNIADFEREQEENAIISYQELLKAAKKDFPQIGLNEIKVSSEDNKKIDSTVEENDNQIVDSIKEDNNHQLSETIYSMKEDNKEERKFKNSIFISPIGITNNDNPNYYKEVKIRKDYLKEMADSRFNTVDIQTDNLNYEIEQNEKFLEDLKNFRSNL